MSASLFDHALNARLNDVPLPAGLLNKLRAIGLTEDAALDAALADVPLPAALLPRLARLAQRPPKRRSVCSRIRENSGGNRLPRPDFSRSRLHGGWAAVLRHAVAALLIFAVSLGYALSAVAFVCGRFEGRPLADAPLCSLAAVVQGSEAWIEQCSTELEPSVIELPTPPFDDGHQRRALDSFRPARLSNTIFAVGEQTALASVALETPFERTPAEVSFYDARPIERASLRLADSRAIDLRLWRQTGILPWLDPVSNCHVSMPLVRVDTSYRLALQKVRSGRLPAAAEIRCEEFVAGIDYGLESAGTVYPLIVAAAPSPFAPPWQGASGDPAATGRWLLMVAAVPPGEGPAGHTLDTRLNLEFSIEHVAAYRVLGYSPPENHPSSGAEELEDSDPSQAASAAVVLCEIELKRGYERYDALVNVSLGKATDDGTSNAASGDAAAVVRSGMFSPDFDSAPVIWQQAALAALAAERLAGSPCAERSLGEIAALARQIEPAVYDRPGWQEFIVMLVHAQSLQSSLLRAF